MLSGHEYACDWLAVKATHLRSRAAPYIRASLHTLPSVSSVAIEFELKIFFKIFTGTSNYRSFGCYSLDNIQITAAYTVLIVY